MSLHLILKATIRTNNTLKHLRYISSSIKSQDQPKFETVFSFPTIKYIALLKRLTLYQFCGTCIGIPTSALLETSNIISQHSCFVVSYIGLTGVSVLSLFSFLFNNTIGHIYISEDNKLIKISSVNFLGSRRDKIIPIEDWIPLSDMEPRILDGLYLKPKICDGSMYKLFIKFGEVKNKTKISQVLE